MTKLVENFEIDQEFDIMLLTNPKPEPKPVISFYGHNEVASHINLRRVDNEDSSPKHQMNHLFQPDNYIAIKSMVSNASSIIPCSADSFVIIGEDQLASIVRNRQPKQKAE